MGKKSGLYKIKDGNIVGGENNGNSAISQITEKWEEYFDQNEAQFYLPSEVNSARRKFVKAHLGENYPQPGDGKEHRLTIRRDKWLRYKR